MHVSSLLYNIFIFSFPVMYNFVLCTKKQTYTSKSNHVSYKLYNRCYKRFGQMPQCHYITTFTTL